MKFEEIKKDVLVVYDGDVFQASGHFSNDEVDLEYWKLSSRVLDYSLHVMKRDVRLSSMTLFDIDAMVADQ